MVVDLTNYFSVREFLVLPFREINLQEEGKLDCNDIIKYVVDLTKFLQQKY